MYVGEILVELNVVFKFACKTQLPINGALYRNGYLLATDGKRAIKRRFNIDGINELWFSSEAYALLKAFDKNDKVMLSEDGALSVGMSTFIWDKSNKDYFPKVEQIFPNVNMMEKWMILYNQKEKLTLKSKWVGLQLNKGGVITVEKEGDLLVNPNFLNDCFLSKNSHLVVYTTYDRPQTSPMVLEHLNTQMLIMPVIKRD